MDNLRDIARLIRENPSISVRELAVRLGYSEAKSIYYWLEKGGYRGIKPFREAVLRGDFPPERSRPAVVREKPSAWPRSAWPNLPLAERITPAGEPVWQSAPLTLAWPAQTREPFAFRWFDEEYSPLVEAGDYLLIEPETSWDDGDLVLLQFGGEELALRRIYPGSPGSLLLHPLRPRVFSRLAGSGRTRVIGRVFRLLRDL